MTMKMKERGLLAPPEVEALAAAKTVADTWGVAAVRPCVAQIFFQGASRGDGRQPLAHLLGVEMFTLGLPNERTGDLLREWNLRVAPPLPEGEIRKVLRRLERPGCWSYSCKNPKLAVFCIGEDCPHGSNNARWEGSEVTPNGLTASGWIAELSAVEVKVFLGLYRLARLKGRGPAGKVPFCFRELERVCGVNRRYHRDILNRLQSKTLLAEVHVSDTRGKPSTFSFPPRLPAVITRGE